MLQFRQITGHLALTIVIVLGRVAALSAEVTVVGTPWPGPASRACPCNSPTPPPLEDPIQAVIEEQLPADAELPMTRLLASPNLASWYTRIDYLQWTTRYGGVDKDGEHGPLWTLGYLRRVGAERFRFELFGGNMKHSGGLPLDETIVRTEATATHFGGRGEYDYLWNVDIDDCSALTFFAGIGTRLWSRDISDGTTEQGMPAVGYQQTWWTVYPYVGSELRWSATPDWEFYASSRFGSTVINYLYTPELMGFANLPAFYPQPGLTGQVECGLRHKHLLVAAYFEAMSWPRTHSEHLHDNPSATEYFLRGAEMYTTGLKMGLVW